MKKARTTKEPSAPAARSLAANAARAKARGLALRTKKLDALVALVRRRKGRITEDFYDIGEALRTIRDERLHEVRAARFEDLVEAELGLTPSTAYKLIAVVERLPREEAVALGQEKSYALVTYAAATPEDDSPASLLERGAKVGRRAVRDASANQLKAAASALRATKRAAALDADDRAREKAILAALKPLRLGPATVSVRGKTLTVRITLE